MENATGGFITAGADAGLFVVGDVGGPTTVSVSGYVVAESWGSVGPAPMLTVQGGKGADAWMYGLVNAQVTSVSGPASLTTLNSAWTSSVTGTTALLFAAGNTLASSVTGTRYAEAATLGSFDGSVSSQGDAVIVSEGGISGSLNALKDAYVYAQGSVTGGYSAGRDMGIMVYGSLNAGINAGRDVVFVTVGGDLEGSISAGNNIGGSGTRR